MTSTFFALSFLVLQCSASCPDNYEFRIIDGRSYGHHVEPQFYAAADAAESVDAPCARSINDTLGACEIALYAA